MNKGIAALIRDKMLDIPFIELFGGIVYTQTKVDRIYKDEDDKVGTVIEYRFPVTCDYKGSVPCDHKSLKDFIPNSKLKGMLYFEDNGVSPSGLQGRYMRWSSRIRMVVWLNTQYVDLPACNNLTTPVMNGMLERIIGGNPINDNNFQKVVFRVDAIPPVSNQIFSRYTYEEKDLQFLMPPFEYFAIDLSVDFTVNPNCLDYVQLKTPDPCLI